MEDKEIEKLLKESADEVKVKDFSERWENIKERINPAQEVEVKETASETVLATSANSNFAQNSISKILIYSVCAVFLFIVICLAIVLPITLKKNDMPKYLDLVDLKNVGVSENEFHDKLGETDLTLFNVEEFDVNSCTLLYTEDNILVGGRFEISDEIAGLYAEIVFYDATVTSSLEIGEDYKTCAINGFNIEYKTVMNEELYSTTARAVGASISYEFECLSLDENIESFFEKIFG